MSNIEAVSGEENSGSSTRNSTFSKDVVITTVGSATHIIFLFLETMIAVRFLDPDHYGVYVLVVAVVTFTATLIDLGSTTAATQLIASSEPDRQIKLAHSALAFRLVIIVIAIIVIWLGQDLFGLVDSSNELVGYHLFIPLMLASYSLDELFSSILQGFHAYRHMAISQAARGALRLLFTTLFLVVLHFGTEALIYSWILSFAICSTYQFLVLPVPKGLLWDRPLLGEILRFGFPIQLNQLVRVFYIRVDVLLLGALVGPTGVALYAVAARIPQAVQQLSDSYTVVFFPTLSTLLAKGQTAKANWVFNSSLRLLSFASAIAALIAVLFSHEIISLVFSEKYATSSWVFALLMIGLHISIIVNLMGYTLTAAGYPGRSLIANTVRVILNVLANLVLVPLLGFVGPALARLLAVYLSCPLDVWFLRRSGILVTVGTYIKQTVLLLACTALCWWTQPSALLYKAAIIVLFMMAASFLSTIEREDFALILPEVATKRLGILQKV